MHCLKQAIKSRTTYSESKSDSNFDFGFDSVSDFNSDSDPDSDSDCKSVFMNLGVFILFILYLDSSKQTCG